MIGATLLHKQFSELFDHMILSGACIVFGTSWFKLLATILKIVAKAIFSRFVFL